MKIGMGIHLQDMHVSSAPKRWKTSLAALLSLTLGLGMAGVAPAHATPSSEGSTVSGTAETRSTEEVAVGQPARQGAEQSTPPADEDNKKNDKPAEVAEQPNETQSPDKKAAESPAKPKPSAAQRTSGGGMTLTKSVVGATEIRPGDTVTYELKPGCSSIQVPCTNAVLTDALPAPLVFESVDFSGFDKKSTEEISNDKTQVKLTFNETSPDHPGVGINAGADYTVTITAKLPLNASPEFGGLPLKNSATLTSDAGTVTDEAEVVTPVIPAAPSAAITKAWAEDSLQVNSGAENTLTLGGIANSSKVGATSLTITEPSGGTTPFDAVAFTGFDTIVYPEGADKLEVTYVVGGEKFTATPGSPNAPPAFPNGTDLSTITGFVFTFTSSASTAAKGGINADGTPGSIKLNTVLRDGAVAGNVENEVSITAQTPKGDSAPATAEDDFIVEAVTYAVNASKSFSPESVVAEGKNHVDIANKRSTVTIGATNTSNKPLKTLGIKEPATGTDPFGAGIDFEKFVEGTWPAGATSGAITIGGTSYPLATDNGKLVFPGNLPGGKDIKSFEINFAGEFAPATGFELKFDVFGTTAGAFTNTITAGGEPLGGGAPVSDDADATLTVVDAMEALIGQKYFSPSTIEGIAGDKTTAVLNTKVDQPNTNVDVRTIVQTDVFGEMVPVWKPTTVKVDNAQGATGIKVEYKNAGGAWVVLEANAAEKTELALPADALGVQITYTRATGTFPHDKNVSAHVGFELTELIAEGKQFKNILNVNNGQDSEGKITADKQIRLYSTKDWGTNPIVQKPSNMNPASELKLAARNDSTFAVDSLSLVDPTAGTVNPFDYVAITGFQATLSGGATPETARLSLAFADGTPLELEGDAAVTPVLPEGKDWSDVVGFEFKLVPTGDKLVVRGAAFNLSVGTSLRDNLRGTDTPIDEALATINYTIPNKAEATIKRGAIESATLKPGKDLVVITENSVDITPVLTKSFDPAGPATFFPNDGKLKPLGVTLKLDTGKDAADKIVIEDQDPTFWNAFDFAGWSQIPTSTGTVTIEYLSGATFTKGDGNTLVSDGKGTWSTTAPADGDVQGIRITMQGTDYTPLDKTVNEVKFKVLPRYTLRSGELNSIDGTSPNPGETSNSTVENTATAEVERLGQAHEVDDATDDYQFTPGATGSGVSKTSDAKGGTIAPGRDLKYTFTVTNTGTEAILNPVITDKLPADAHGALLELDPEWTSKVKYSFVKVFGQAPEGTSMTTDPALVGAVRNGNDVEFTFPEGTKLYPGESYTIELPTTVRAGLPASADLTNTVEFTGDNSEKTDDGNTVSIIEGQAYASQKLVREVPSEGQEKPTGVHNSVTGVENDAACYDFGGGFYRYPCVVETKPGGTAEWKLSVTNTGNVPSQHLEILDVFPFPGDTGVTATQNGKARESQWTPTLQDVKLPEVPEGTTMVLSYLTGDPATCKPTGEETNPWAGCETGWTTNRPANPKEIRGLKLVLDFEEGLAPKDSVSLSFTTTSGTEMPEGAQGKLPAAWNSFGYAAQAQVNGKTDYRSQEPIKTGITFRPVEAEKVSVGDYVWLDENKDGIQDESEKGIKDVTLVLTGPDGNPVTDVYGNLVLPTMTDAEGHYTFENLPVLEKGQSYTVSIDQKASAEVLKPYLPTKVEAGDDREKDSSGWVAVTDPESDLLTNNGDRDPSLDFGFFVNPGRVSVGDYVWVDSNRDGIQDEGEPGIPGVVLELVGPDGKPVTDVFGNPVGSVTTDEDGKYSFENLPVLKDGESYTVKIDREASAEPLAPYIPTKETEGEREKDSSTWEATSEGLTEDGQRDPSLDFGFVLPKVSVGDYVWVDSNRDGIQDEGEPGIPGVVLDLYGPDGKKIGSTITDKNGNYLFKDLPVLKDGESYVVKIDRKKSKEALAPYIPTKETEGDREKDSSTWESHSTGLNVDGESDLTLDFGFVLVPEEPELPATDGGDNGDGSGNENGGGPVTGEDANEKPVKKPIGDTLAATGFAALGALVGGLLLILGGVALARRRTRSNES